MKNKCTQYCLLILLFLTLWSACTPWIGWWPESNFILSPDSRLPKWFTIPSGYNRKDVSVKIDYYTMPYFNFKATLLGPPPEYKKLDKKIGRTRWHPSMKKKKNKYGGFDPEVYPMVTIETVEGITEILEQRRADDILYVSDDPELRKAISQP